MCSVFFFDSKGTFWTTLAHIITAVIGSGVLSLAWSMAQLGWIAGPLSMLAFAGITIVSSFLLCDCYRPDDSDNGVIRNHTYMDAVRFYLGKWSFFLYIFFLSISSQNTLFHPTKALEREREKRKKEKKGGSCTFAKMYLMIQKILIRGCSFG